MVGYKAPVGEGKRDQFLVDAGSSYAFVAGVRRIKSLLKMPTHRIILRHSVAEGGSQNIGAISEVHGSP